MERAVRVEVERKFKSKKNKLYAIIFILLFSVVASTAYSVVITIENNNIIDKILGYDGTLYELKQEVKR